MSAENDQKIIDLYHRLHELTGDNGMWPELITKDWLNRLVQIYSSFNIIGSQIDGMRKENKCPTKDQMKVYRQSVEDFYRLLEVAGIASVNDPGVEEVI